MGVLTTVRSTVVSACIVLMVGCVCCGCCVCWVTWVRSSPKVIKPVRWASATKGGGGGAGVEDDKVYHESRGNPFE